ncbi:MAG: hypothetical protein QM764_03085 [Chitinophagaceae bacterium]
MNKYIAILCMLFLGCSEKKKTITEPVRDWILQHETEIVSQCDSLEKDYREHNNDTIWETADIAISNSTPGVLGSLAEMAGDSSNCVVVELTVYKSPAIKHHLALTAIDSACLKKLGQIRLTTDSTDRLLFTKNAESLQ